MNNEFHILSLEGWPTLLAGGQERSLFEVVRGLRKRGVTFSLGYEEDGELLPLYQDLDVSTFRIQTRRLSFSSQNVSRSLLNFIISVWRVLKQSRSEIRKWDLIYVNQYFDLPLAVVCGKILKIPVYCHLRLNAPHYLSRQYRWGLNRCRLLICNSHFTAKTYKNVGIPMEKLIVIHNGIDTEEFSPTREGSAPDSLRSWRQILCLGRIAKDKGIEHLVDAISLSKQKDPRLRLLVVGNPRGDHTATQEYLEYLQKYARARLGDSVKFKSAVPDVVELYRLVDLVVIPSEWEEPFGRVVIESMACGVPCLASKVGGIPEILIDDFGEFLVKPKDPNCLGDRILKLIDWRTEDPLLGDRCRRMIERSFNSKVMCDKLYTTFSTTI